MIVVVTGSSIGSAASRLIFGAPDRLVLIYHNITPAEWFAPYALGIARDCQRGRDPEAGPTQFLLYQRQ